MDEKKPCACPPDSILIPEFVIRDLRKSDYYDISFSVLLVDLGIEIKSVYLNLVTKDVCFSSVSATCSFISQEAMEKFSAQVWERIQSFLKYRDQF
jgi:hypothetical protein